MEEVHFFMIFIEIKTFYRRYSGVLKKNFLLSQIGVYNAVFCGNIGRTAINIKTDQIILMF